MSEKYYVLWVRHCESCANVAMKVLKFKFNLSKGMYREPLCTNVGIMQSFGFGHHLKKLIDEFPSYVAPKISGGIRVYSSVLPRAMETAKFISLAANIQTPIKRILYVQEKTSWYEGDKSYINGSVNVTNFRKSNCHAKMLNNVINTKISQIDEKIIGCDKIDCKELRSKKDDYDKWKQTILPQFDTNKLNIIVSHGKYIKHNILSKISKSFKKPDNLGAFLIEYSRSSSTEPFIEKFVFNIGSDFIKSLKINEKDIIYDDPLFTCKYSYKTHIESKYCSNY